VRLDAPSFANRGQLGGSGADGGNAGEVVVPGAMAVLSRKTSTPASNIILK
jgi:hypothetical protein